MGERIASPFLAGHATHHDWRMACELALAQIEGQGREIVHGDLPGQTLAWVYMTAPLAAHARPLLAHLIQRTGINDWTGCCAERVLAGSAEYVGEPAIALMLGRLPSGSFRLFSGRRSDSGERAASRARWLQVHADPQLADVDELLQDLARRHGAAQCYGGITSGIESSIPQMAGEVLEGGLSGVIFSEDAGVHIGFTQGCAPIGAEHRITRCDRHLIREIDDRPALDVLLDELGMPSGVRRPRNGREMMACLPKERLRGGLLVELGETPEEGDRTEGKRQQRDRTQGRHDRGEEEGSRHAGHVEVPMALSGEVASAWVRNLLGIDTVDGSIAIAGQASEGARLRFCTRDANSARSDLVRMCTRMRDIAEERGERLRGAVYVSCLARGEHLFGRPGIETEWVQHYLGISTLVGFHANGEIHTSRLHGYSAVLIAFS